MFGSGYLFIKKMRKKVNEIAKTITKKFEICLNLDENVLIIDDNMYEIIFDGWMYQNG